MNAAFQVEGFRLASGKFDRGLVTSELWALRRQVASDGGMSEVDALAFIDAVLETKGLVPDEPKRDEGVLDDLRSAEYDVASVLDDIARIRRRLEEKAA